MCSCDFQQGVTLQLVCKLKCQTDCPLPLPFCCDDSVKADAISALLKYSIDSLIKKVSVSVGKDKLRACVRQ